LKEAIRTVTGFELIALKQTTGMELQQLGHLSALGTIWILENRKEPTPWRDILAMSLVDAEDYFPDEGADDLDLSTRSTPEQGSSPTS
jgi:hypothetical protein